MSKLLSAGEFARLARTTKRTVIFYDEKDIIKPFKIDDSGYRWYKPSQIIDFQVILLLRKLNFSLLDIYSYLEKDKSLKSLFRSQKETITNEIESLQLALKNITKYYHNLETTGSIVKPKLKEVKPLSIYYFEREAAYADIKDLCFEVKSMFRYIPKKAKYIVLYTNNVYSPKKSLMRVGIIKSEKMVLNTLGKKNLNLQNIDGYKALSYTHHGSGALLSMLWKGLEKYFRKYKYEEDPSLPYGQEIYHTTSLNGEMNEDNHKFEIQISIKK